MRYHSTFPAMLSVDLSAQRAHPTCKLSLANVSACTTVANPVAEDPNAMQVDPSPFGVKTNAVPFPTAPRKHSLLRPSLKVSVDCTPLKSSSTREPPSPTEQTPPRKRTRTTALSPTPATRPRSHRLGSSPSRSASSPQKKASSATFIDSASSHRSGSSSKENEPFVYPFPAVTTPTADHSSSHSCATASRKIVSPSNGTPLLSATRRRKVNVKETSFQIALYKTLTYGLAVRSLEGRDMPGMEGS